MLVKSDLGGFIGATKSHRVAKGAQPACDRFRVVIPWESRITDVKTFEQNMLRLTRYMPIDPVCKDGARFYWPCTESLHFTIGDGMSWAPYEVPPVRPPSRSAAYDKDLHTVPPWMEAELKTAHPGTRNKTAFKMAIRLKERAWTQSEVVALLGCYIDLEAKELERTVQSAWRY
jgi:hypothetical protein